MSSELRTSDLSTDELSDRICELAAHIAAATYRWLRLLSEFDRRQGWGQWGIKSCAHWLAWRCGYDLRSAREKVRVARALDALPLICEAFSRGELSYSKVRAITRIATPATEADLVMLARSGTTQHVEKVVRGYRRCLPVDAIDAGLEHERRFLEIRYDEDGTMVITAKLPREEGELLRKAIEKRMDDIRKNHRTNQGEDGSAEPFHDRADALVAMARADLQGEKAVASSADRYQVVIHADVGALKGEDGMCYLAEGSGIASETVKRLLCDCSFIGVVRDADGNVLDMGRKTRSITPSQRRALNIRDVGCVFPGCTNFHFTDGHHIRHWIDGGDTALTNLALLCSFHHRLLHEGGFTMQAAPDGSHMFFRPDGRIVELKPVAIEPGAFLEGNAALEIEKATLMPRWGGEACDYNAAVGVLLQKRDSIAGDLTPDELERFALARSGYTVDEETATEPSETDLEWALTRYGFVRSG